MLVVLDTPQFDPILSSFFSANRQQRIGLSQRRPRIHETASQTESSRHLSQSQRFIRMIGRFTQAWAKAFQRSGRIAKIPKIEQIHHFGTSPIKDHGVWALVTRPDSRPRNVPMRPTSASSSRLKARSRGGYDPI